MATDALTTVQASVTKTSTFTGAAVNLVNGTPRRGYWVRVIYSAAATASGTASAQFDLTTGATSGGTFYTHTSGAEQILSLTSTAQSGEIWLPLETSDSYFKLVCTLTDTGSESGMTVTYSADLVTAYPA